MVITSARDDTRPDPRPAAVPGPGVPLARRWLRLGNRVAALPARLGAHAWLYALVPVPFVTEWIENGGVPSSPREWLPEVCAGIVIALLVARVRRDQRALEALARTDGLTGLLNRRTFAAAIEIECARARRSRKPLSVVYLDIDGFKGINDRFGHAVGDDVLRELAVAIEATIRARVDSAFRLGGDEFALLLPASTREQAASVVERIRATCAVRDPRCATGTFEFSAGIVAFDGEETAQALLARGDRAMYDDKTIRRATTSA